MSFNVNSLNINRDMIEQIGPATYKIPIGFVPNMKVPGLFYATPDMADLAFSELENWLQNRNRGLPSILQIAFVATLDGITEASYGMPDMHSGYGFSIGGVAAFDTSNPDAIISPGGVGYDINCGVRCMTTGLTVDQVRPHVQTLIDRIYKYVPAGVGGSRKKFMNVKDVQDVMAEGVKWAIRKGYGVPEDAETCEEHGCISYADPSLISERAIKRGIGQVGTLGAGNHYIEIQEVSEILDARAAEVMGLKQGEVIVMIHTGSRGLGYQIADDFIKEMRDLPQNPNLPDRELSAAPLASEIGQRYLHSMGAAANFAWCNRQVIMHFCRQAFKEVFPDAPLRMDHVYDVCHNIAKLEKHVVGGVEREFIVHRKGATRSFGPNRPEIPEKYREIGQPVLVGGSLGTASYVLVGTEQSMSVAFGSTCHGAGRVLSRTKALKDIKIADVKGDLHTKGIILKAANKSTVIEEAPATYKDIEQVVDACEAVGLSKKVARLLPMGVVKG